MVLYTVRCAEYFKKFRRGMKKEKKERRRVGIPSYEHVDATRDTMVVFGAWLSNW